jgi:ribosomal protein S18 acetylase RimI-like enzyme
MKTFRQFIEESENLFVKKMEEDDMSDIMDIENNSFQAAPWSEDTFLRNNSFTIYSNDKIIGYLVLKEQDADTTLIVKMAVHPKYRRSGVGRFIVSWAKKYANNKRLFLHVRQTNPAYKFYLDNGFKEIKRIQNYYKLGESPNEKTAVEMELL